MGVKGTPGVRCHGRTRLSTCSTGSAGLAWPRCRSLKQSSNPCRQICYSYLCWWRLKAILLLFYGFGSWYLYLAFLEALLAIGLGKSGGDLYSIASKQKDILRKLRLLPLDTALLEHLLPHFLQSHTRYSGGLQEWVK